MVRKEEALRNVEVEAECEVAKARVMLNANN